MTGTSISWIALLGCYVSDLYFDIPVESKSEKVMVKLAAPILYDKYVIGD